MKKLLSILYITTLLISHVSQSSENITDKVIDCCERAEYYYGCAKDSVHNSVQNFREQYTIPIALYMTPEKDLRYSDKRVVAGKTEGLLAYVGSTALFHALGKAFYAYSGAPRYFYNKAAIYSSDLNIFTFPEGPARRGSAEIGRRILIANSIFNAPIRSLVGSASLLNPLLFVGYCRSHPHFSTSNLVQSAPKIAWSAIKMPRYSIYPLIFIPAMIDKYAVATGTFKPHYGYGQKRHHYGYGITTSSR